MRRAMIAGMILLGAQAAGAASPTLAGAFHAARYGDIGPLEAGLPHIRDHALATLARTEIAAARMDRAGMRRALAAYRLTGDRDPTRRARAWSLAASAAFAEGDYTAAAAAARHWRDALRQEHNSQDVADADQLSELASLLALAPRMTVARHDGATVPTERDAAGLLRAIATIDGIAQSAVLDTGANLSTVSASAAARLHLRMLDGMASVSSATRQSVATRIGIADRLDFAGYSFRNVPFLVLDDAQLRIPLANDYAIDAIIGFPVFHAMGSITFAKGRFTPGLPADVARSSSLRMHESDLFVALRIGAEPVALQLDTGAAGTSLSAEFARDHSKLVAGLPQSDQHIAGAGGVSAQHIALWPAVPVAIGGSTVLLDRIPILTSRAGDTDRKNYGSIGQDLLGRFASYTIDFRAMRFSVAPLEPPTN